MKSLMKWAAACAALALAWPLTGQVEMLAGIHRALKPNGKLVIVEYYKTPAAMPNGQAVSHIRLNKPDVIMEIEANHFRLVSEREQVKDSQYMLILEKN